MRMMRWDDVGKMIFVSVHNNDHLSNIIWVLKECSTQSHQETYYEYIAKPDKQVVEMVLKSNVYSSKKCILDHINEHDPQCIFPWFSYLWYWNVSIIQEHTIKLGA